MFCCWYCACICKLKASVILRGSINTAYRINSLYIIKIVIKYVYFSYKVVLFLNKSKTTLSEFSRCFAVLWLIEINYRGRDKTEGKGIHNCHCIGLFLGSVITRFHSAIVMITPTRTPTTNEPIFLPLLALHATVASMSKHSMIRPTQGIFCFKNTLYTHSEIVLFKITEFKQRAERYCK